MLVVGPSRRFLGGQAVQAERLVRRLSGEPSVAVQFLPVDPVLPGPFAALQRIRFVRTLVTSLAYGWSLLRHVPRCDVVHAYSASYWSFLLAPVPAMLVARLFGKRVLLDYHSGEAEDHLRRFGWHVRPLLRLAHVVSVPGDFLVAVFGRFGIEAVPVSNLIEPEGLPYRRRERPGMHLLANRNLEPMYGVDVVLRAFARIQAEFPEATLSVAGRGSQRPHLERLVDELGLRGVRFLGGIPPEAMREQYASADLYLNASRIDNMPLSLLEAFACGLPVVTTDAGGIPFIADNRRTARVVPVDDHEALAAAALDLLRDPAEALRLADAARAECLARYTWPAVRDRWLALYGAAPASAPVPAAA